MVSVTHILKSFNDVIDGKCMSIASMKEKLASFSREEKIGMLNGRLSTLEWDDYNHILNEEKESIDFFLKRIDEGRIDKDKIPLLLEHIEDLKTETDEELFKYNRRILENYTIPNNPVPSIDEGSFKQDKDDYDRERMFDDDSTIGGLEANQIRHQQESNVDWTKLEKDRVNDYFFSSYSYLNTRLHNGREFTEYNMSERGYDEYELAEWNKDYPNVLRSLDNAIGKSTGLVDNSVLYRAGAVDIGLDVGMHGVFKGYVSTSFQKETARMLAKENRDGYDWVIKIYSPKGTKGIAGNDHANFSNNGYTFEHEYLLGRNTGYTVINIDKEKKEYTILLDS